jgi:long-chain acyl-CoA synthetase
MSNKPWLDSYPADVPRHIDQDCFASLNELLEEYFERYGDEPAYVNRGTALSFRDAERESRAFAAYLQSQPGFEPGARVAVMLPNLLQSPVTVFGVLRAGGTVVNVNPLYTARELQHVLADSGARILVVLDNFAATAQAALARGGLDRVIVSRLGDHFPWPKRVLANWVVKRLKKLVPPYRLDNAVPYRRALQSGRRLQYRRPALAAGDIAFLQYTGGTTGRPKGAMLSHGNIVSNILQASTWFRAFFDLRNRDALTALPLYHIFALTINLFALTVLGARNVLITNPRDLRAMIAELKNTQLMFMTGVNTLFNVLLNRADFKTLDLSQLKVCLAGGMAVQRDVAERWRKLTGVVIVQGYGLTETSPLATANPLNATEFSGSVGLPVPSTEIKIVDDAGVELAVGELGEICIKGPQVMVGYWRQPEETAATFLPDGWLRTGDIGRLDERGYVFIEDRKKDLIIVSGFNVYPNEIEDVVTALSGVHEAAAIGVPNKASGEAIKLLVVRQDPALSKQAVLAHCRRELTRYKVPSIVEFIDELPKSNVGKVLRRELRDASAD